MRAIFVFGLASAFVSFVACGSADVGSIFGGKKNCTSDQECDSGSVCKVGVCLATASGGASGTGGAATSSGGAIESGGRASGSGGAIAAGGASSGGIVGTGGSLVTGGSRSSGGSNSSGGSGPDAGSGGSVGDGGSSDTGGSVSTGGASTGGKAGKGGVYCGDKYCPGGQICCAGADWSQGPAVGTFTCTTGTCGNQEAAIECSSHDGCHQGQKCCQLSGGRRLFGCMEECPGAEIECTGPNVCPGDEMCCETTTTSMSTGGEVPEETQCQSTCMGGNGSGEYILCHSNNDCPDRLPRCDASNLLPGFKRCWPGGGGPGPGGPGGSN